MALNFPNSPTANQIYTDTTTGNRYVWDAVRKLWKYSANTFSSVAIQDAAPGDPAQGALWWDRSVGRLYIYYTDADSSQWVEATPSGASIDPALVTLYSTPAFNAANVAATTANNANSAANNKLSNGTVTISGTLTSNQAFVDSKGDVRDIPATDRTSNMPYAITIADTGKMVLANGNTSATANIFVPNNVFYTGNTVMITNLSTNTVTITQNSSVTMFLGGTSTTGNRSLAVKGIATLVCVGANNFIISGAGVT